MKIGFVGLGVMGAPMAGHLLRAGHEVVGFNRSPEKAVRWAKNAGGRVAASVGEAAASADLLILCVGNDDDVRATVTAGLEATAAGATVIDHTTTSAVVAREMAELAATGGRRFLDAPVSGGQAGAEAGKLSVMVGGDAAALERARPALEAYSKSIRHMGPAGAGQLTKMVNQICIAGVVQGLAEAVQFTERAGLDPEAVLGAISQGAAQSWQMDNRWATMSRGEFDFGFAVDWMRKDLGLVLDEARRNGGTLALTALVDQFYAEVQAMGGSRWDTSSLAARLKTPPAPRG
ncbi:NAD(P)-dependent oxidoreductase [Brevundimonas sp.]|uniref:NAD(P)-dependent oxidoreductase n=1 Tax=Brevundimonas sp. TaxID=1871086 RepID=UPI002E0EFBBD|nr:NAD(P)-dependent oxidoreductase [Brevundimonas sp.]